MDAWLSIKINYNFVNRFVFCRHYITISATMSTNNNRLGKEVRPEWRNAEAEAKVLKKVSGQRLAALMSNSPSDCTALSLSGRGVERIEDLEGFGSNLRRLDLSENELTRVAGMINLKNLSMLNLSSNKLAGDAGLEDLRYLE